jgi:hypothetical protein
LPKCGFQKKKKKKRFKGTKSLNIAKMWFSQKLKNKVYAKNSFFFFFRKKKNFKALFFKYNFRHALNQSKKEKKNGIFIICFNPLGQVIVGVNYFFPRIDKGFWSY